MKRNLAMIVLALALCMALALQKTSAANDEAAIRQNLDEWARAFERHDINGIMAMYAPNVVAYDFIPPLQYRGRDTYRKDYEEFLAQFDGPVKVEFRDMTIAAGDKVGYAYTLEHMSGKQKNGQAVDFWGRCTSGFQKINGKWLDMHDHCSVPTDFETGKAALDLKP